MGSHPTIKELFSPAVRRLTLSGFLMALIALVTWWACNAFISVVAAGLAQTEAARQGLEGSAVQSLVEAWKKFATSAFNIGGLIGTLLTVPVAKYLGRRPMFALYFLLSALALFGTFGLDLDPHTRLYGYFFIGLTVFGVFGSFTYYLPELFPTRLRGTGAGFCYNAGRFIAAAGPFLVGLVAAMGADASETAVKVLFWVGAVPAVGVLLLPLVIETKGKALSD